MRRILTASIVALLGIASVASAAPPAPRRTATGEYTSAGGLLVPGFTFTGSSNINGTYYGSARIRLRPDDRSVAITVKDDAGTPVTGVIAQDSNDDGQTDHDLGEFCGSASDRKLPAVGGVLVVFVMAGTCGTGPSAPTSGVVTAEITRAIPKRR